ncbi:SDR family NAD(P)-dependent oxidoreductase [Christiangramia sp. SM2212]|uniref:SDR family NAD(P)-dependent oxidoreductase n=1 Tax=Christiangramia sediminicola TaxID=3073267 RepID=A0ABU1ETK9_9FLAO|nr:SDR family NAD(P)-dependent oxidoreductase [Christiangramia sp. SM2212]MDR5591711.1 SDR family NAD(P)-dependent oxidoreductase [Christiangramia sp. SM2212]
MKRIVITGTSRGIGFELVKTLSKMGHQILALSRNEKPVKELKLENVHTFSFDITSDDSLNEAVNYISENWDSKVDVLINNAGALLNKPFKDSGYEDFLKVYQVNVFGVAEVTRKLLPFMEDTSHVLNISSMGGIQGSMKFPGLAAYSSSKGALLTLTELLAEEYKENGPSFNALALGAVQTEMLEEAFPGYKAPVTAEDMAAYIADFSLNGQKFYNGKIMQVSNSTP